jgi:hypothetical protein
MTITNTAAPFLCVNGVALTLREVPRHLRVTTDAIRANDR